MSRRESEMENQTRLILNDLLDVVDRLTEVVREMNPGADLSSIDFLIERAEGVLEAAPGTEC
jgi:hypothetical protein